MQVEITLTCQDNAPKATFLDNQPFYDVEELSKVRGSVEIRFERGEVKEDNTPILIIYVELLQFLNALAREKGTFCLYVDFEPTLYALKKDTVVFTWFDPTRYTGTLESHFLDEITLDGILHILKRLNKEAEQLFSLFGAQLSEYLMKASLQSPLRR